MHNIHTHTHNLQLLRCIAKVISMVLKVIYQLLFKKKDMSNHTVHFKELAVNLEVLNFICHTISLVKS